MDFAAARTVMIDSQVRTNDVHDRRVIAALMDTPRELFVPEAARVTAYAERTISTGPGRSLWAARDFSKLLLAAAVGEEDRVLDIAPGSGYSSAVLSRLAAHVCALEETEEQAAALREALRDTAASGVDVGHGPLKAGRPGRAPFDVIFVNGAVSDVPDAWIDQLTEGGRLAVVVSEGVVGRARIYTRSGGKTSWRTPFEAVVPLLPGFEKVEAFRL